MYKGIAGLLFIVFIGMMAVGCGPQATDTGTDRPMSVEAEPISVLAFMNVSSGCQDATVNLLKKLEKEHDPRLHVEIVDFGDGGEGAKRWQEEGHRCMLIMINGHSRVKYPLSDGTEKVSVFEMPVGFMWAFEDLENAVAAAVKGQLHPATEEEAAENMPAAMVEPEYSITEITKNGQSEAQVAMNGHTAITIRTAAAGKSPRQRAEDLVQNLQGWMAEPIKPDQIERNEVEGGWMISAAGHDLILVTEEDGKATGNTAEGQAKVWLVGIRQGVTWAALPADARIQGSDEECCPDCEDHAPGSAAHEEPCEACPG